MLFGGNSTWGTRIRGRFPSKFVGTRGTNENRVRRKHVFLRYFDAGNMTLRSADRAD